MAKKRGKRGKSRAALPAQGDGAAIYQQALDMALRAFGPAIAQAQGSVKGAQEHLAPGGTLDQSYDRSGGAIRDAQAAVGTQAAGAQATAKAAGGMAVDATAALGAEQVLRAHDAERLYGQTAQAAIEAAKRQGGAAIAQGQAGANMTGYLGALGVIGAQQGVSQVAANEGRRGEARTVAGRELTQRNLDLEKLLGDRGTMVSDTATKMAKDERDYQLASATVGATNLNSFRDYKAAMAGIADSSKARDAANEPTALELAKYDVNGNGVLDPGEAVNVAGGANGKGRNTSSIIVGRDGRRVDVTPGQRHAQVASRQKVSNWFQASLRAVTSGKHHNAADVMKAAGIRSPDAAEMAYEMAVRKARGDKHLIDRKWLPFLRTLFFEGNLPMDLARQVDPVKGG